MVQTPHFPKLGQKLTHSLPRPNGFGIVISPLIDVFFLLMIFFMMGNSVFHQPGITVVPPEVDEPLMSYADKLVITLTKENLLFFNDQEVQSLNDLPSRLDKAVYRYSNLPASKGSKEKRLPIIIIKADKDAPYDDVVKIMSITRKYGAKVYLLTQAARR